MDLAFRNPELSRRMSTDERYPKVLIVEDEPVWQRLLNRVIHQINPNIELIFTASADSALESLREQKNIGYIICDQNLEGLGTGLDIWDTLLEEDIDIPFVLLAGNSKNNFISSLYPYRKQMLPNYIEKPGTVTELSKTLKSLLKDNVLLGNETKGRFRSRMKKKYYWMILATILALSPLKIDYPKKQHTSVKEINSIKKEFHESSFISKMFSDGLIEDVNQLLTDNRLMDAKEPKKWSMF